MVDSKLQGCRESIPLPWKSVLAPLPVPLSLSMPNFNSCWKEDLYPSTLQEMKRNAEADWRHDTAHLQLSSHHISSFCCQGASGKCTRCKDLQCRCQTGECGKNVSSLDLDMFYRPVHVSEIENATWLFHTLRIIYETVRLHFVPYFLRSEIVRMI